MTRMDTMGDSTDSRTAPTPGVFLIAAERHRQMSAEGWTPEHDDEHADAALVCAAICYAEAGSGFDLEISPSRTQKVPFLWPWEESWWKPSDDLVRNLAKAGALIAAEIDRLQRAAMSGNAQAPIDAPPFVDTPVLQAKRRAFDDPTQVNLDALIAAVRAECPSPESSNG
jgi:hypothetical protein